MFCSGLCGLGANIFDIPLPFGEQAGTPIDLTSSDLTSGLNFNPFKAVTSASFPGYNWYDPIYNWLEEHQGIVWGGAALAVAVMVMRRQRGR